MAYSKQVFYGLLIQGRLREAVSYLTDFPAQQQLLSRYLSVFQDGKTLPRSRSRVIRQIDAVYQGYYRLVFWEGASRQEGVCYLCREFSALYPEEFSGREGEDGEALLGAVEAYLERLAEKEGYHLLGGTTSGWYGPYIWEKTEPATYDVLLPSGERPFTIYMMDGFVSRSWLDFLSFGKVGTGGWTGEDGGLYCVRKSYRNELTKPSFTLSFLKHEAQHAVDMAEYPGISPVRLEYRAKLVELIYYPDISKFRSILNEADGRDESNAHAYASFLVMQQLSRRIFHTDYEGSYRSWYGKVPLIRSAAGALLEQDSAGEPERQPN